MHVQQCNALGDGTVLAAGGGVRLQRYRRYNLAVIFPYSTKRVNSTCQAKKECGARKKDESEEAYAKRVRAMLAKHAEAAAKKAARDSKIAGRTGPAGRRGR